MIGALTWSSVDRIGQQTIQFGFSIILLRLLNTEDYGLMGMVMIFSTLSFVLVEGGFNAALIRTKEITKQHANTVFFSNLFVSTLLYFILYCSAPYIADFFKQHVLCLLIRVASLAIIFNSLYLVPFSIVSKALDYKKMAKINMSATLISGVFGIILAYRGYGVWSLAYQQVSYHFFRMIGFLLLTRWVPEFIFSIPIFKELWIFSVHILGSSLLSTVFNNIYIIVLGKFYPIQEVGLYTQANKMSETTNFTFQSILGGTSYNFFAQIHHDKERVKRALRAMIRNSGLITLPITLFLIASADSIFFTLFGEKWMGSVPYFQLICTANLLYPIYYINNNALNSIGKSKISFRIELIKRMLIGISILVCFDFSKMSFTYGILSLLIGYIVSCYTANIISFFYTKKHIHHYYRHQIEDIIHGLWIGLIVAISCYCSAYFIINPHLELLCNSLIASILYVFLIRTFYRDTWDKIIDLFKKKGVINE